MGTFEIRAAVNTWLNTQTPVALCTVTRTWGSSPRRAGSKLAVTAASALSGSVSGGCVEAEVITQAQQTLQDGELRVLYFDVADETALEVGLACGGSLTVMIEALDTEWWAVLTDYDRHRLATVTLLQPGATTPARCVLTAEGRTVYARGNFPPEIVAEIPRVAAAALQAGHSHQMTLGDYNLFTDVHLPQPRLVIIGGAHVAIALQHIAVALGFRVLLIDPRKTFASRARFPAVEHIYHAYPDKVLPRLHLDNDTYLAVLSHDAKIDDPALLAALDTEVRYIGVMSSRRTHLQREERLQAKGVSAHQLNRLSVPVGLDIGATTPEEIALSIMAEIVAVKNGKARAQA